MNRLTKITIAVLTVSIISLVIILCTCCRTITVKIENPLSVGVTLSEVENQTESSADNIYGNESVSDVVASEAEKEEVTGILSENSTVKEESVSATVSSGSMSKEQIVSLYNTAVNKVKTDAKTLTRNYHHLTIPEDTLELPSAIQGIGKSAISTFVKGDDNPQSWTSKEDITTIFPVGGESYSSHLTASMVKTADYKDNGTSCSITLILYDDAITSPEKGSGYAGVFNTTSASTFSEISIPTVTFNQVDINGINGSIKCTIDKSTGHVTDITFANTDVLKLNVKVVVSTIDCKMEMIQEDNYKIEY